MGLSGSKHPQHQQSGFRNVIGIRFEVELSEGSNRSLTFGIPHSDIETVKRAKKFLADVRDGSVVMKTVTITLEDSFDCGEPYLHEFVGEHEADVKALVSELAGPLQENFIIRVVKVHTVNMLNNFDLALAISTVFTSYGVFLEVSGTDKSVEKLSDLQSLVLRAQRVSNAICHKK